jgi:hypothetical protein
VRCNERRPRCAHCERLNLDCNWNRPQAARSHTAQTSSSAISTSSQAPGDHPDFNPNMLPLDGFGMGGNSFFDFSNPLNIGTWDEAMLLSPNSWPSDNSITGPTSQEGVTQQPIYQLPVGHRSSGPLVAATPIRGSRQSVHGSGSHQKDPVSTSPFSTENAPNVGVDEAFLLSTFLQMLMPPILTPVEVGPKWASTRAFFRIMATESLVVKSAIMAFAAMQMQRSGLGDDATNVDWRPLYDSAARLLADAMEKKRKEESAEGVRTPLKFILASFFLLTYTDVSLRPLEITCIRKEDAKFR